MNTESSILFNSHLTLGGFDNARILHLMQNDKTPLEFELKDKNKSVVSLDAVEGEVQIIHSETDTLKAIYKATVKNGKATFVVKDVLEVGDYEVYIKINNHYFPSSGNSFIIRIVQAYDVVDIDTTDRQTIDIVVDAVSEEITPLLLAQTETIVRAIIEENPEKFKGEKGDKFTINDFTEEEFKSLRGEDGNSLTFEQLDSEQQEALRGHSAYQVAVNEGFVGSPEEWYESLRGEKGDTGSSAYEEAVEQGYGGSKDEWLESLKGKDGTVAYNDLDHEQKHALHLPPRIYTRDEYNNLPSIDPNTLYFIEGV